MWKRKIFSCLLFIFIVTTSVCAQKKIRISGFVKDKNSEEVLIGANIVELQTSNGVASDNNGFFSILTEKEKKIHISFIGYGDTIVNVDFDRDTFLNVYLYSRNILNEVLVEDNQRKEFNTSKLNLKELTEIPSLGGKPDIGKSLQLLPGIASQGEGSSIIMVRGGDPGQNMYLFDNVPVIYVNHLGGFLSVFNPDIINSIDVYKGGFPAKYGGRLSSIINITQREGDMSQLKGVFSIGLTDASFALEGPLKLKNSSFIVTGRKTLAEPLMAGLSATQGNGYILFYGFHDINAKASWRINNKNNLSLNLYYGDDYLQYYSRDKKINNTKGHLGTTWGNWLVSAKWNRVVSLNLFATTTLSYTRYRLKNKNTYNISGVSEIENYKEILKSNVNDYSLRSVFKYSIIKNWSIDFGLQSSLLVYSPNNIFRSNLNVQSENNKIISNETALYIENNLTILKKIHLNAGLRVVAYFTSGYSDFSPEPRININWDIFKGHTFNLSYTGASQFSHLIFTAGNIMNNELWFPASSKVPGSYSHQYTVGWSGNFANGQFSAEVIGYYKDMTDLATIKEGYSKILGDDNWESKIETGGIGKAKGIEVFVKKNKGVWKGFVGYSLSRTTRKYGGINNGEEYLFGYDRTHSFSVNLGRQLNEKWKINLTWVYQTGMPYTPIVGRHYTPIINSETNEMELFEVLTYGERNSERMRAYHRLDLGVTYSKLTKKRKLKSEWSFSIYNLYCRQNPFIYFYSDSPNFGISFPPSDYRDMSELKLYQRAFLPIIPTFSYKIFFDKTNKKREDVLKSSKSKSKSPNSSNKDYNKWNIKLNYLRHKNNIMKLNNGGEYVYDRYGIVGIETNYKLVRFLEIGAYSSFGKFFSSGEPIINPDGSIYFNEKKELAILYGGNLNIHILPLLLKNDFKWVDIYLASKLGGQKRGYGVDDKKGIKYGIGAGMNINIWNNFGLYAEYIYDNVLNSSFNLKGGIVVSF